MEKFRKKLAVRITWFVLLTIVTAALLVFDFLAESGTVAFHPVDEILFGFQSGALTGFWIVALFVTIRYIRVFKNEKKLQLLYNEEHDERLALIRLKSGMPALGVTSIMMLLAGIIAGYFNRTVFITLVCVAVAQSLLGIILKVYYKKTLDGGQE